MSHLYHCHAHFKDHQIPIRRQLPSPIFTYANVFSHVTFGHLTAFALVKPCFGDSFPKDWTQFLNPFVFPSLSQLSITVNGASNIGEGSNFVEALISIAPQLETLSFSSGCCGAVPRLRSLWPHLHKISYLSLDMPIASSMHFYIMLATVPTSLRSLLLCRYRQDTSNLFWTAVTLQSMLSVHIERLSRLQLVRLAGWSWPEDHEAADLAQDPFLAFGDYGCVQVDKLLRCYGVSFHIVKDFPVDVPNEPYNLLGMVCM